MGNEKFCDGSYACTPGIALLAKVLAGRCPMRYTRAAVGGGALAEGESPKTMAAPAGYVMDAMIAAVSNPVDGECQVTVQLSSADVEIGFFVTGVMLYALDPDEGEVPYTYLVLENEPEWIRPRSAEVGKLATFDLIAAVGAVDRVTATLDPDAIMTRAEVESLIQSSVIRRRITLPAEGWEPCAETGGAAYDLAVEGVTEEMIPLAAVLPSSRFYLDGVQTLAGIVRFYAGEAPPAPVEAELTIMRAVSGELAGLASIPIATADSIGGVKIPLGSGLRIDADGSLSIDAATAAEVEEIFAAAEIE